MQEYKEAWTKAKEQIAIARQTVKNVFEKEAMSFVKSLAPLGVESFSWTQYTPYFNDGDACVFGVYNDYPNINGFDEDGLKYDPETGEEVEAPESFYEDTKEQRSLIVNFLNQFEEDDYEYMFGDHVKVTVSATGIEVEDYEHD